MNHVSLPPRRPSAPCFDAGSPHCPCDLAFLGTCVACSIIRGEDICRCGWSGLCVYQEFAGRKQAAPAREETLARVSARTDLQASTGDKQAFIVDLATAGRFSAWCVFPGSFVMMRPEGTPSRYNVPVSVMRVQGDTVQIAVEVQGPKTLALSSACAPEASITVAGPYWSGLQGATLLRTYGAGRVLVIAKGIGQAPALNTVRYLATRGGHVKALLGPGLLGTVFVDAPMRDEGVTVENLPREKDHNMARIYQELCYGYDLLISEGGDQQHRSLLGLCSSMEHPPAFAWSPNLTMTCAEGICGSCIKSGQRGCKAQLDPAEGLEL